MHQYDELLAEQSSHAALVERAVAGDETAFEALYERHALSAWRLSYAITGTRSDAVAVVSDSFARTFTALRAGRAAQTSFRTLLLQTVRHQAIDARNAHGDKPPAFQASERTLVLATAFASLPERWKSALWLRQVEGIDPADLAPIVDLDVDATNQIVKRARRGLREQFVRADLHLSKDRNCERAVTRLTAYAAGRLPSAEVEKLERHLGLCESCLDRHARLIAIPQQLPTLVPALPPMLEDDVRLAWAGAVETSGLGLSAFGEKILAGVAALAAGVGVLGAAMVSVSGSGNSERAVAPIAPIVTELASPRPPDMDLRIQLDPDADSTGGTGSRAAGLTADDEFDGVVGASARRDAPVIADLDDPGADDPSGSPIDGGGGDGSTPPTTTPPGSGPGDPGSDPVVSVGTDVGGVPIAVEVGDDTGVTVGPISVGSEPTPGGAPISVGGPLEPLAPIVDPVGDAVGGLLGG